ncbi:MAG: ABC transporter permease [Gammaproteobacteria bacterium]
MGLVIAWVVVALWVGLALFGPLLPLEPNAMDLERILSPPSARQWLGYDDLGRAVMDRMVVGARTSFLVSVAVVSICAVVGTVVGTISGYYGGLADRVLVHVFDVFLAFPGILLAIAMAAVLGPGIANVVIALSVMGWVGFARLARAQVLSLKHRDHVLAARALGTSDLGIVRRHLVPLIAAPLIVEATFGLAAVMVAEAGLSFLGLGVQPPEPSWGTLIRDGAAYMLVAPHMLIVPVSGLAAVVLAVNILGDRVRDRLDVRASR